MIVTMKRPHHDEPSGTRAIHSIDDIKAANEYNGYHFFDTANMRFANSRIGQNVYGGRYFVTSERDIPHYGGYAAWGGQRRYTVREILSDGSIHTVSEYGEFDNSKAANRYAAKLSK